MGGGVAYTGVSDCGLVRKTNEDALGIFGPAGSLLGTEGRTEVGQPVIAVLSDGVGGQAEGEVASSTVVAAVGAALGQLAGRGAGPGSEGITEAVERSAWGINAHLRAFSQHRGLVDSGMAATLTAAWLAQGEMLVVHVGDSRLYRWREGALQCLTRDDTEVADAVRQGRLSEKQAQGHRRRHVLSRAMGVSPSSFGVTVERVPVRDGDQYLLCSDGLTDGLPDKQLATAFAQRKERDGKAFVDWLIEAGNRASGKDNLTVIHLEVEPGWCAASRTEPAGKEQLMKKETSGRSFAGKALAGLGAAGVLALAVIAGNLFRADRSQRSALGDLAEEVQAVQEATRAQLRQQEAVLSERVREERGEVDSLLAALSGSLAELEQSGAEEAEALQAKQRDLEEQMAALGASLEAALGDSLEERLRAQSHRVRSLMEADLARLRERVQSLEVGQEAWREAVAGRLEELETKQAAEWLWPFPAEDSGPPAPVEADAPQP